MTSSVRLFLGVPLVDVAADEVQRGAEAFAAAGVPGRVAPRPNWHLTLRFLGDSSPEQTSAVAHGLTSADLGPAFDVFLRGWGAFPKARRANVLWIGIDDPERRLARLAAAAETAALRAGYEAETRPFRPHLTLSRLRRPTDLTAILPALPPIATPMRVDRLVLFRSILGPSHPRYEPLHTWSLASERHGHETL
jgi:RNA 2',3'-cyclic 3'-phosphodiesterase